MPARPDLLVCPVCRAHLFFEADVVSCTGCGRTYPGAAGELDLTPVPPPHESVRERWALWEELQRNGERAYVADPLSSLSVGERDGPSRFAAFCRLEGRVLDVGCGPQAFPSYAAGFGGTLVGIDPLRGEQPRRFSFVNGIAEYLPFPDASFDRVLFATSLDHVLSPELAVGEAARVVKPAGQVVVWLGEPDQQLTLAAPLREAIRLLRAGELREIGVRVAAMVRNAPARPAQPKPVRPQPDFEVPVGAVDAFHVAHPNERTVRGWLEGAGLRVTETERPRPGSCFLRARPGH